MNDGGSHIVVAVMRAVPMSVIVLMLLLLLMIIMRVSMIALVSMVMGALITAGQQPGADHIDHQTKHGNRDRLVEADRHRLEQARDRLIADQERDHCENDGAGVAREIAKFAGAEAKASIIGIFAGIGVRQCRQQ